MYCEKILSHWVCMFVKKILCRFFETELHSSYFYNVRHSFDLYNKLNLLFIKHEINILVLKLDENCKSSFYKISWNWYSPLKIGRKSEFLYTFSVKLPNRDQKLYVPIQRYPWIVAANHSNTDILLKARIKHCR